MLLGENQSHTDHLKNRTTAEGLQNYLNDHDLHLVIKNGEPHLIDELNSEVYALKDISNLRGVSQIETMSIGDYPKYRAEFAKSSAYILMDLAGSLNDKGLKPILENSDYIICPFRLEKIRTPKTIMGIK
jgi:hypothetical protein